MKYGVIKIAAGVFFGLLAAFFAYQLYENWALSQLTQERPAQQPLEAQELKIRTAAAAKALGLGLGSEAWRGHFTSNKLFELCGAPLRDKYSDNPMLKRRSMEYLGADGHRVELWFEEVGTGSSYIGMYSVDEYSSVSPHNPPNYQSYYDRTGRSYEAQVEELPCLLGLAPDYPDYHKGSTK